MGHCNQALYREYQGRIRLQIGMISILFSAENLGRRTPVTDAI